MAKVCLAGDHLLPSPHQMFSVVLVNESVPPPKDACGACCRNGRWPPSPFPAGLCSYGQTALGLRQKRAQKPKPGPARDVLWVEKYSRNLPLAILRTPPPSFTNLLACVELVACPVRQFISNHPLSMFV